jgi:predicted O-methyltransferase YrrM
MKAVLLKLIALLYRMPVVGPKFERLFVQASPTFGNPQLHFFEVGHFYSPLPAMADIEKHIATDLAKRPDCDGVDYRRDEQLRLLEEFRPFSDRFDWPEKATPGRRYYCDNNYYSSSDHRLLLAMMLRFRPKRIVEVGSGFSSALMLDINDRDFESKIDFTFVEPYPERLLGLLNDADRNRTTILKMPVQEVPMNVFDALEPGDFLFIDSSHVSKFHSDVNHLFFEVLPRLKDGVFIHVHDIFYPFEYPHSWYRQGRAWNESYFLRAFLQYNRKFRITFFNNMMVTLNRESFQSCLGDGHGAAIWLEKIPG